MAPMYYRGAQAAILVYDITSEESFTDMNTWVEGNKLIFEHKQQIPNIYFINICFLFIVLSLYI